MSSSEDPDKGESKLRITGIEKEDAYHIFNNQFNRHDQIKNQSQRTLRILAAVLLGVAALWLKWTPPSTDQVAQTYSNSINATVVKTGANPAVIHYVSAGNLLLAFTLTLVVTPLVVASLFHLIASFTQGTLKPEFRKDHELPIIVDSKSTLISNDSSSSLTKWLWSNDIVISQISQNSTRAHSQLILLGFLILLGVMSVSGAFFAQMNFLILLDFILAALYLIPLGISSYKIVKIGRPYQEALGEVYDNSFHEMMSPELLTLIAISYLLTFLVSVMIIRYWFANYLSGQLLNWGEIALDVLKTLL